MKKIGNIILLALPLFMACVKEVSESSPVKGEYVTINACMADEAGKSTLVEAGTKVYWEPGDAINVFVGNGNYRFSNPGTKITQSAAFVSDQPLSYAPVFGDDDTFLMAVYPYDPEMTFDGVCVTTTLCPEQTARDGSFSAGSNITAGRSSNFNVVFRQVCGGVRFSLTKEGVKTVSFESVGQENIAGKLKISFEDGVPTAQSANPGRSTVTLTAPGGGTFKTGVYYYISCIPGVLASGFRMRFITENETAELLSENAVEIKRGCFADLKDIDKDLVYKPGFTPLYEVNLCEYHPENLYSLTGGGCGYDGGGFYINEAGTDVILNRYHSLGERMVRYQVCPTDNAIVNFHTDLDNTSAVIDVPNRRIYIRSSPTVTYAPAGFLRGDATYTVEIIHRYRRHEFKVVDQVTGAFAIVSAEENGTGGLGRGNLNPEPFSTGVFRDHYCVALEAGTSVHIKTIGIYSLKNNIRLLMVGDSISQPEAYYPRWMFSQSWTQLVIRELNGNAMSAGRCSGTVDDVFSYIQNELPYIEADYVMITIGTNGGNTVEKLSGLVQFIKDCGSIPILNNMPCNESGTQVSCLPDIQTVRGIYDLKGVRFDEATSLSGDGKKVDESLMFEEEYYPGVPQPLFHHPNVDGARKMFQQIITDVPEIFNQ